MENHMPIYEFYCQDCHTVYSFFARRVITGRTPACPKCARRELRRRPSTFAISKSRGDSLEPENPDFDDSRLEQAVASLAGEMGNFDENDPKQMAGLMRKLYDSAGMKLGPGMEEMIRRIEAGEDAEAVEEELGDALDDENPFGDDPSSGPGNLRSLRRRHLPPTKDPTLYDFE